MQPVLDVWGGLLFADRTQQSATTAQAKFMEEKMNTRSIVFATVKPDGLNVHAEPNLKSSRIDAFAKGDRVQVLHRTTDDGIALAEIKMIAPANRNRIQVGTTGWVRADLVEVEEQKHAPLPPRDPPAQQPKPLPHRHYRTEITAAVVIIAAVALLASCFGG